MVRVRAKHANILAEIDDVGHKRLRSVDELFRGAGLDACRDVARRRHLGVGTRILQQQTILYYTVR